MSNFETVRWGIIGPGGIANQLAKAAAALSDHQVIAVASRDRARADAFADTYNIPKRFAGYEALVADPDVDVVYVATPHSFHKEHSLLALNAGKPVMCEKPFTINAAELEQMAAVARDRKLFLMEGMWTRFFPVMARLRELLAEGAIGDVMMLQADFAFRAGVDPQSRLFNPDLGGGGLLDVGVYTVSLASMVFGNPDRVTGLANLGSTGVDETAAMVLGYPGGGLAALSTGVRVNSPFEARILGSDGRIAIHPAWWRPEAMTLTRYGQPDEEVKLPANEAGFVYEMQEVARCLREGLTESPVMPLSESIEIMRTMDTLRAQWGLRYPMEAK